MLLGIKSGILSDKIPRYENIDEIGEIYPTVRKTVLLRIVKDKPRKV